MLCCVNMGTHTYTNRVISTSRLVVPKVGRSRASHTARLCRAGANCPPKRLLSRVFVARVLPAVYACAQTNAPARASHFLSSCRTNSPSAQTLHMPPPEMVPLHLMVSNGSIADACSLKTTTYHIINPTKHSVTAQPLTTYLRSMPRFVSIAILPRREALAHPT